MIGFFNIWMLIGLAGIAIPPLIHLLNRRRFIVIDWGAMQFLQISETTRRRLLIEEVILMLMRMVLIAVMVFALASPYPVSPWLAQAMSGVGSKPNRDVVIVFDGSYSMGYAGEEKTPHEKAKEWAKEYVKKLSAGDSVTVLQAKQQVLTVHETSHDLEKVREAIDKMPEPRGGCDWPGAIGEANKILESSRRTHRDIVVLSDGQHYGWADSRTLRFWDSLTGKIPEHQTVKPTVWVVDVTPENKDREKHPPNWSLAPIRTSRAVSSADQEVKFRTALQLQGQDAYKPPYKLRLEIDGGKEHKDIAFPMVANLEKGRLPLTFSHKFSVPGSHLVSVIVEPDPPKDQRLTGYEVKDQLPGDNRQDIAVEIVKALPVLIVDGDERPNPKHRGSDFIQAALAPKADDAPAAFVKVVSIQEFVPPLLVNDLDKSNPGSKPRVLILCNVSSLKPDQQEAIVKFLSEGGSVLVTLGDRADVAYYNQYLYRNGAGWLPARLDEIVGNETEETKAMTPLLPSFANHPALDLFREPNYCDLALARFPRWWKVSTPASSSRTAKAARLSNDDPFLVERSYDRGRVMLCVVPMDRSWRTNLTELDGFVLLVHELVYYLAGAREGDYNLQAGQPLRYRPERDVPLKTLTLQPPALPLQPPEGEAKNVSVSGWPLVYEETRDTGIYRLTAPNKQTIYYVCQPYTRETRDAPDLGESNLTTCKEEDQKDLASKIEKKIPLKYEDDREKVLGDSLLNPGQDLWWWFMIGVIMLLCSEVWMTRRIAMGR